MERVVIIGNGGAGKSTFARQLATFTGLPLYHLDRLFWNPGWTPTPDETWVPLVRSLVSTERWIAEGNYGGTMPLRMERADTIIWLDYGRLLCTWRAFRRGLTNLGRRRPYDMAPGCAERVDREFLTWVWNYRRDRRPAVKRLLRDLPPGKQIVVLHDDAQAARYLLRLYYSQDGAAPTEVAGPTIRLALPADAETLARIHIEGWQTAYAHIFPPEAFAARTIEGRTAEWAELLDGPPGESRTWVSEVDGRIAGFAYTRSGAASDIPGRGELKLFYVDPALRGRGIGLPLFNHAITDLESRGLQPYLYTLKENSAARAWYEKRGWRPDGAEAPWSNADQYPDILEVRYRPA